jgi:hypothetical protein
MQTLALACAVAATAAGLAAAQDPSQTVRAAIPPQAPVAAKPPMPPPELAPSSRGAREAEATNVRLDVTITYQVGNAAPVKRTATLMVADQGRGFLRSGSQVAVPQNAPPAPPAGTAAGSVSYNYKSVGLNVDAGAVNIQGNKTKLMLSVEFSAVAESPVDTAGKPQPPSFPTFSENLSLVLESGRPLVVGQSSDFVGEVERKQSVEVKATILR